MTDHHPFSGNGADVILSPTMANEATKLHLERVAPAVRALVEPFLLDLERVAAGRVHSRYGVGSAATGDWREDRSDVNVLLMLREMDLPILEAIAPLGKKYGKKRVAAPLVLDIAYVRTSLDAFPMEFLELKLVHETVLGEDLLAGIAVHPGDLRQQCEREVKSRLLGLRQGYLGSLGDPDRVRETLVRILAGYLALFRGILVLLGKTPARGRAETLGALAAATGLDIRVFEEILAVKEGRVRPAAADLLALFERCYHATEQLGRIVDELPCG
jgi:predicted nucleotidyltransferase